MKEVIETLGGGAGISFILCAVGVLVICIIVVAKEK